MKKSLLTLVAVAVLVTSSGWVVANIVRHGLQTIEARCYLAEHDFLQSINK